MEDFLIWVFVIGSIFFSVYSEAKKSQKKNAPDLSQPKVATGEIVSKPAKAPKAPRAPKPHRKPAPSTFEEGTPSIEETTPTATLSTATPKFSPRQRTLRRAILWGEIIKPKYDQI